MGDNNLRAEKFLATGYLSGPVTTFGENFRRLQKRAGLTGAEAAEAIRAHESQVSQWRRDTKGLPELPTLLRIAKGLRCTVDELLQGVDPDYDAALAKRDLTRPPSDQESGASDSGGSPTNEQARQLQQLREEFAAYRSAVSQLEEAAESIVALAAHYHEPDRRPEGRQAARKKPRRGRPHRKAG